MPMFRKKPVVIDAFQVPSEGETVCAAMQAFLASSGSDIENTGEGGLFIHTLEGRMEARPGDYIIKGVQGEFYPCKPDIFEATYEAVIPATMGFGKRSDPPCDECYPDGSCSINCGPAGAPEGQRNG